MLKSHICCILLLCCTLCVHAQEQVSFQEDRYGARYREALAKAEEQRYGEALVLAHQALDGQPGNAAYNLLCGDLYIQTKQYQRARPYIVRALGAVPALRGAYRSAIDMELGEGSLQRAAGYVNRALMHFPDDLEFTIRKLALLDTENRFAQGDALAGRILSRHPGDEAALHAWKTHHLQAAQYFTDKDSLQQAQLHLAQAERTASENNTAPLVAAATEIKGSSPFAPEADATDRAERDDDAAGTQLMLRDDTVAAGMQTEDDALTPAARAPVPLMLPADGLHADSTDTLALSRQLRDRRRYRQTCRMLHTYLQQHPDDVNALWLCAQTELWRQRFREARVLYEEAAAAAPGNDYLMLDYASALAGMGSWEQANALLAKMEAQGRRYSAGRLTRANILYWSADYDVAKTETDSILAQDPGNEAARTLREDILQAQSPYVQLSTGYTSDNQPVQSVGSSVEAGMFRHRLLAPYVSIHAPVFMYGGKTSAIQQAEAGNKFLFPQAGMQLALSGGVVKFAAPGATGWTGALSLRQQVRRFLWEAQAAHKPYLYTITSLDTAVSYNRFALTAGWQDKNGPDGRLAAEINTFAGGNFVYTLYGWLYASPLKFSIFTLRLGYSYSYSDAHKNSFVSKNSLAEVIAAYDKPVTGMYNIYITPEQQHIHAALLSLQLRASAVLDGGITADAGLFAQAQNPYLYLDKADDGTLFIARDYAPQQFFPYGAGAYANWRMTRQAVLTVRCSYRQTWFFSTYQAALGLKINFWNDRKAQ